MSFARSLHRKIDDDLAERILASGSIRRQEPNRKEDHQPRPGASYRGARRNEAQRSRQAMAPNGKRKAMIRYDEILKINAMRAKRQAMAKAAA